MIQCSNIYLREYKATIEHVRMLIVCMLYIEDVAEIVELSYTVVDPGNISFLDLHPNQLSIINGSSITFINSSLNFQ